MTWTLDGLRKTYKSINLVDLEYGQLGGDGGRPQPRCVVSKELNSGRTTRLWLDGSSGQSCPYDTGDDSLFVAYYASAETQCHIELGWPMPSRVLDLCAEAKCILNGRRAVMDDYLKSKRIGRASLLGVLYHWGLFDVAVDAAEKTEMQGLAIRGGPYSETEKRDLLDYNETDVVALEHLLPAMLPQIDFPAAIFRGRYAACLGYLEHSGIPIDLDTFQRLKANWGEVVDKLIDRERHRFDVIKNRDVCQDKLAVWLSERGLNYWPTTPSGKLSTDSNDLHDMSRIYRGEVHELKEFLSAVRKTRLFENLSVGTDGRNRFMVSPFNSKTGRNQPSSKNCIFGPSIWVRSLIKPAPGFAIAYLDFGGQEYATAGYFSGDQKLIDDYWQDDPYLGFGKRIGLVPLDATKKTHYAIRNRLKICCGLGCIYGAGFETVARAGDMTNAEAKFCLSRHKDIYADFWSWRHDVIHHAAQEDYMRTPLGWTWFVDHRVKSTTASNWPMQSAAADMLRVATCLTVEAGVKVIGVLHDALLIESPISQFEDDIATTTGTMVEASRVILDGGELKVDVERIVHPNRWVDENRGRPTWDRIRGLLDVVESDGFEAQKFGTKWVRT